MREETSFGPLLRQRRKMERYSMGDIADRLGLSVSIISDVERGERPPFSEDRIRQLGAMLGDVSDLLKAAERSRSNFRLPAANISEVKRSFAAALERRWYLLSDADVRKLHEQLNSGEAGEGNELSLESAETRP